MRKSYVDRQNMEDEIEGREHKKKLKKQNGMELKAKIMDEK